MKLQEITDGPRSLPAVDGSWSSARLSRSMVADYKPFTFVDGPGVRCALYVSGCPFRCVGCYNQVAQSFRYGNLYTQELEDRILEDLAKPYVAGLSLLGGEPLLNTSVCLQLVRKVRERLPTKTVWAWTGYTWEQLQASMSAGREDQLELLRHLDVLVDGPFIQSRYSSNLAFRGSSNQRIIDVPASLDAGEPIKLVGYRQ
ncbi:anaerobic ribonucleoside-triphosphate reductase activating protein [Rothia terrae]|uniref:anaerobic ribonucleoside-triphosphate reductase activating protein n=2 Tax=Rothia terrae TaxID=396015 RepID=UPI001446EDEE|nr:anaerobic ribonucleoside-triphosphate reductase activating protein [Rothia terrae]